MLNLLHDFIWYIQPIHPIQLVDLIQVMHVVHLPTKFGADDVLEYPPEHLDDIRWVHNIKSLQILPVSVEDNKDEKREETRFVKAILDLTRDDNVTFHFFFNKIMK